MDTTIHIQHNDRRGILIGKRNTIILNDLNDRHPERSRGISTFNNHRFFDCAQNDEREKCVRNDEEGKRNDGYQELINIEATLFGMVKKRSNN